MDWQGGSCCKFWIKSRGFRAETLSSCSWCGEFIGTWPGKPHHGDAWPPLQALTRQDDRNVERKVSECNDSPNPLRSSLCLVISYICICVFFCIAGTAYRSDLLCGRDVKDGGPCPHYENSFGPGLRTYVESGDCTNGLGESLLSELVSLSRLPAWPVIPRPLLERPGMGSTLHA